MWDNVDLRADYARARYRDFVAEMDHERQVQACARPLGLSRRAARPLGRALFSLGAWLLHYGEDDRAAALLAYRASARSIELN